MVNKTFRTQGSELNLAMEAIGDAKLGYTWIVGDGEPYLLTHTRSAQEEARMVLIGSALDVTIVEVKELEDRAWWNSETAGGRRQ